MSRAAKSVWPACASAPADCVLIGGAVWLLLSGLSKAHDIAEFAGVLSAHRVIPYHLVGAVSMFVPSIEISVPLVALWLRVTRPALKAPWLLCATMFVALAMYASALWLNPPPTPARCGCIGAAGPVEHWGPVVVRNVGAALLLAGSLLVKRDGEG